MILNPLLKNKNFLCYLFGRNSSSFGDLLLTTGLALHVMQLTRSATQFSSIMMLTFIPRILLSPFSGVLVDRVKKKSLMVGLDLFRSLVLVGLYFLSRTDRLGMGWIYTTVILFGVCDTFFGPAMITIFPKIVKRDELGQANAIEATVQNIVNVISPLAGSVLYALVGLPVILLFDGVTFLLSALSELWMTFDDHRRESSQAFLADLRESIAMITGHRRLTSLVANGVLSHVFLFPFIEVGMIYLIVVFFEAPEFHFGIIRSAISAGTILASLFAMKWQARQPISTNINLGILGMLLSVGLFSLMGFSRFNRLLGSQIHLPVIYLSLSCFLMFFAFGFYGIFFKTFYQAEVPDGMLGKFSALFIFLISLSRLVGMALFGFLFEHADLFFTVSILFIGMVLKLIVHIPFMRAEVEPIES